MAERILIVDDEPHIRTFLRAYLEADGFDVVEAGTGRQAVAEIRAQNAGLAMVLLDIGLPDLDGIEVLRRIRASGDLPVILVTARAEEVDKLIGLAVGADDYVVKPFGPREVVARVKAVLRRASGAPSTASSVGGRLLFPGLTIDRATREVTHHEKSVELTALEFDILVMLAAAPGRVYTRAQILEEVWGYDHLGDERVVDVHVGNIRRRLSDDAVNPSIIGTVRGVGYKFVPKSARQA